MVKTEQEAFWAGEFGDEYIERNENNQILVSDVNLFSKIFSRTIGVKSIIEFGANIGMNLKAIRTLMPETELSAIEINKKAADKLSKINGVNVYHQTIFDFVPDNERDFVFIKGVLIHINPDMLKEVYELLYKTSKKYICIVEYYNPTPVAINYRGHSDKLFKRDFAGEMLDMYKNLSLVDYGFVYHRDNNFPQDDSTWFLMQKNN